MSSVFKIITLMFTILLVLDPLGNLPVFASLLREESPKRYCRIVLRESLIAFAVLLLFLLFGKQILALFQVSQTSVRIAGGVILFIIALKMIFSAPIVPENNVRQGLFVVPLAIPLFAGPSAVTTMILFGHSNPLTICIPALVAAWLTALLILLAGRFLQKILGQKVLEAFGSMMGFLLAIVSVEMFVTGICKVFHLQ